MTIYGVTGATGGFGSHVIRVLLDKGVAPGNIVAIVRDRAKAGEWEPLGLDVRLAEAAATVMLEPGHEDAIYELGGDTSFSYTDFAQTLSRLSGTTIGYTNLTPEAHRDALVAAGLTEDDAG